MDPIVLKAAEFAKRAHAGQMYGNMPYEYHLSRVVEILREAGVTDPNVLAAAWLHDTIEDTDTTYEHIKYEFGGVIAGLVWAVTDGEGKNRKERKKAMYEKARNIPASILIKVADRIANVDEGMKTKSKLRYMYLAEHPGFMHELYEPRDESMPPEERVLWQRLGGLIFDIREGV